MASTPPSLTRRAIAEISAGPCRAVLAPHGFRRAAPQFWRVADGVVQSVSFQASAFGSRDANSFSVNLGITTQALSLVLYGRSLPARPASGGGPILMRLGQLTPSGRDVWWKVDAATDTAVAGAEVADLLRACALPWFDAFATRSALRRGLEETPSSLWIVPRQVPLVRAILAREDGDPQRARSLLRTALDAETERPFHEWARLVAARLGLSLDG